MARARRAKKEKSVYTLRHERDKRPNIPTAEYQSMVTEAETSPSAKPTSAATVTSTPSLSGEARTSRTSPT